jgi:hypothetical protein
MEYIQRSRANSNASENRVEKTMFTLIFSGHGLWALDKLPKWYKMKSQYFCDVVLEGAKRSVTAITGTGGIEGLMMRMGNCKGHSSTRATRRLEECHVIQLAHPPYSPDISPCGFWFFGWSKDMMKGHQFQSADEVRTFPIDFWSKLDQNTLISVYKGWIARLEEVIVTNGQCYSK